MTNFRHVHFYVFGLVTLLISHSVSATGVGPMPISLKHLQVPEVPGLLDGANPIVVDKNAAIALGKALFWDANVGSDGMACGSCHFHAGADRRVKNQLNPGAKSKPLEEQVFDLSASNAEMGPNYTLSRRDFPFHRRFNPLSHASPVAFDSDDVVSSSGTFGGEFINTGRTGSTDDTCDRDADPVFHVNGTNTRRVEPRNTPTVINSVFNHRSFWDGRANNVFNGSSSWGDRDPDAGVWVKINARNVAKQRLHLINSSLASVAVVPPLSDTEMGCRNRTMMDVGRKLLARRPLEAQKVHWNDSVLGGLGFSKPGNLKNGLNTTYSNLIKQAFNNKYWSYTRRGEFGGRSGELPYDQMEANFAMFFGLALQLYQSTLISDESPFDRSARDSNQQPIDLTASERRGLGLFRESECNLCHIGPNFTASAISSNAELNKTHPEVFGDDAFHMSASKNVVNRILITTSAAFFDSGFASTGVAEENKDVGVGGVDIFGNPLSFSLQYMQHLAGNDEAVVDNEVKFNRACDFQLPLAMNAIPPYLTSLYTPLDGVMPQPQSTEDCFLPLTHAYLPSPEAAQAELSKTDTVKMVAAVKGAFKIPGLHNVELTGPYMHNGSMATLEEVIEFYTRGGNFHHHAKQIDKVFPLGNLQFSEQNRADLVAFLKTLTDDRVRYEKAPFDHPEIKIPHGHVGDELAVNGGNPLSPELAQDEFLVIEAVGAEGNVSPLLPFESYLVP